MLRKLALVLVFAVSACASVQAQSGDDEQAVHAVLAGYRDAVEALRAEDAAQHFWPDSAVFEQGGVEGDFATYLGRHLGPELRDFASFDFDNVETDIVVVGDVAYASEAYTYAIQFTDAAHAPVTRNGVATSVLRRREGQWRIEQYHSSARAPRPPS